ncbi:MAG: sialate O-acetylesterase [Pirellulaceae bacterium]
MSLSRCCQVVFCLWVVWSLPVDASAQQPIRMFVLAGQSDMEGHAVVDLDDPRDYNGGKGNLVWSMRHGASKDLMAWLRKPDGTWTTREDVVVRYQTDQDLRLGPLTIGMAVYRDQHHFGPELGIGKRLGDAIDAPVLLVKTCWGGKSLRVDFRPPSSGGAVGPFYEKMIDQVETARRQVDQEFPQWRGRGIELSGFFWFHGWNDMIDQQGRSEYPEHLRNLAADLRRQWNDPTLPIVVGELGNLGNDADENLRSFRIAQREGVARMEPSGSALLVETTQYARPKELSPNTTHGHHWFGNAESYYLCGDAMGAAMVQLLEGNRAVR